MKGIIAALLLVLAIQLKAEESSKTYEKNFEKRNRGTGIIQ